MGILENRKPEMAMFGLQFAYAMIALTTRAALLQGMSPTVFIVYRQGIATLILAPFAYLSTRRRKAAGKVNCTGGWWSFTLIFLASLIGVTMNQSLYYKGLYLASSSIASAIGNLIPAITFVLASAVGLEKVDPRSIRSIAKILGTVVCVAGAVSMALLRGPKLLNDTLFGSSKCETWLLGCLFLFGSASCWSIWLILQVPATASYPDHISLSAWICFLGTLQSAIIAVVMEPDPDAWMIHSHLQLGSCLFSGIIGSGLSFFVQSWCIAQRGPLFSAMFNPLCTIIVTILAAIFLREEIYTGSMIGAVCVITGLYVVLWGKAKDFAKKQEAEIKDPKLVIHQHQAIKIQIEEPEDPNSGCKPDLEEPFLCKTEKSDQENNGLQ